MNAYGCKGKRFELNKPGDFLRSVTAEINSGLESVFAEDPPAAVLGQGKKTVAKTTLTRFKITAGKAVAPTPAAPGGEKEREDPVSYFPCARPPGPAEPIAQLIRGHWGGCEIRNHGTRDVQWEEDKTRSGNSTLNTCLAILRVALIPVKFRQGVTLSRPRIFEQCAHSTVPAFSLINGKSIKRKDRAF